MKRFIVYYWQLHSFQYNLHLRFLQTFITSVLEHDKRVLIISK